MAVLKQKHGDTRTVAWRTNVSLLNSTVRLLAKNSAGVLIDNDEDVEIADYNGGIVTWKLDGTLPPGVYEIELEINRQGEIITAPTVGVEYLEILPDLG
jgi:hypothetical protein